MDAQIADVILSLFASGETDTKKIHATLVKEFHESAPSHSHVKKQCAATRRSTEAEKKDKIDVANERIKAAIYTRDSAVIKKVDRKNKEDAEPHIVDMAKRHIEQLTQGQKLNTKSLRKWDVLTTEWRREPEAQMLPSPHTAGHSTPPCTPRAPS